MTLLEALTTAHERGENPNLALFVASAPEGTRRAAELLAVSIALRPRDLESLVAQICPELDAEAAVDDLGEWPFVTRAADGWHVARSLAVPLSDALRSRDLDRWQDVHRWLARLERRAAPNSEDVWSAEVRTAYYLAGFEPTASVDAFGEAFTHPPLQNPDAARTWLASLARRQDAALEAHPRARSFFEGYDNFVRNAKGRGLELFESVLRDPVRDTYAVASHYYAGLIRSDRDSVSEIDAAVALLDESIGLSQELDLLEPEIRARHSLVWVLFRTYNAVPGANQQDLFDGASQLAHFNQEKAEKYGSALWRDRSAWTTVVADWLALVSRPGSRDVQEAEGLRAVQKLVELRDSMFGTGDPTAALWTVRSSMSILANLGRIDAAIEQCATAVEIAKWVEAPSTLLRIVYEAGRLAERASGDQRLRLDSLIVEIRSLATRR